MPLPWLTMLPFLDGSTAASISCTQGCWQSVKRPGPGVFDQKCQWMKGCWIKSKHKLILKWVWHSLTTHTSQTGLQIFIACYHLNFSAEWNISTIFNLHWLPPSCQPQASAASGRWCLGREDRLMAFLQSCVVKTRTRSGHPGWRQWWFHSHSLRRSFIVGHFCSVVGLGRAAILRQQRVDFSLSKHANKSEPQNKMKYG